MAKNWIQDAVKKPGALKSKAKAAGAIAKDGDIKANWLAKKAASKPKTEAEKKTKKQAKLAETLKRLKKR